MLKAITWTEFLSFILVVTVIYYAAIFLVCYKNHLQLLRALIYRIGSRRENHSEEKLSDPENPFDQASALATSLENIIHDAGEREILHAELRTAITSEFRKYKHLKNTAFQVAINNLVKKEGLEQCCISLSDDELNMLWNG